MKLSNLQQIAKTIAILDYTHYASFTMNDTGEEI